MLGSQLVRVCLSFLRLTKYGTFDTAEIYDLLDLSVAIELTSLRAVPIFDS